VVPERIEMDGKVFLLVISFIIVATVGASYVTYLMFDNATEVKPASPEDEDNMSRDLGPVYALDPFTVNLKSSDRLRTDFVRAAIVLELTDRRVIDELRRRQPQVRDCIIEVLLSKAKTEVNSSQGLQALREELRQALNPLLSSGGVKNVFFTEFVVQ